MGRSLLCQHSCLFTTLSSAGFHSLLKTLTESIGITKKDKGVFPYVHVKNHHNISLAKTKNRTYVKFTSTFKQTKDKFQIPAFEKKESVI
jgi:hypothetical protein